MKRIILKLRSSLVVLLLCVAAVTTANSQEQPTTIDFNALAARGEVIANADPLSAELRNRQPNDSSRRGFDIGMAVAEGHTAPGPGKQRTGNSLPPAEQRGYNIAVSFSLERNRNADLAAKGAAIAKVDQKVAAARTADDDVFYWMGFDIATGIFGDPALGANGNTSTGPGSMKIRDSLSPAGQRGFNASVKFHLGHDAPSSTPARRPGTSDEGTFIDNYGKRDATRDKVYGDWKNAGAEPSNEIRCRGGRDAFIFTAENSKVNSAGETIVIDLLTFEPAPQAAGPNGAGLKPGRCSWADRPMNERFLIRFETPANAQLKQKLHGTPLDTSPTAAERFPDAQTIPAYMNDPTHYWSFFGAKPVNNFFVATGNRYWKPNP
jgi:hypothetical protein